MIMIRTCARYLVATFLFIAVVPSVRAQNGGSLDDSLFNPSSDRWRANSTWIGVEGGLSRSMPFTDTITYGPNSQLGKRRAQISLDGISSGGPPLPSVFRNFTASGTISRSLDRKSVRLSIDAVGNIDEQLEGSSSNGILRALFTSGIGIVGNQQGANIKLEVTKRTDGQFVAQAGGSQGLDLTLYDSTDGQLVSVAQANGILGGSSGGISGIGLFDGAGGSFNPDTGTFGVANTGVLTKTLSSSARRLNLVGSVDLSLSTGAPGTAVITDPLIITVSTDTPGVRLNFIPEPATIVMLAVGLLGLFCVHRHR